MVGPTIQVAAKHLFSTSSPTAEITEDSRYYTSVQRRNVFADEMKTVDRARFEFLSNIVENYQSTFNYRESNDKTDVDC
jgi:hypothetical protein